MPHGTLSGLSSSSHPSTNDLSLSSAALDAGDDDQVAHEGGWVDVGDADDPSAQADCAERWRAAGPESRKKMFALFDASGIFVAVCRHGHVLVVCDMVKSGEL